MVYSHNFNTNGLQNCDLNEQDIFIVLYRNLVQTNFLAPLTLTHRNLRKMFASLPANQTFVIRLTGIVFTTAVTFCRILFSMSTSYFRCFLSTGYFYSNGIRNPKKIIRNLHSILLFVTTKAARLKRSKNRYNSEESFCQQNLSHQVLL